MWYLYRYKVMLIFRPLKKDTLQIMLAPFIRMDTGGKIPDAFDIN